MTAEERARALWRDGKIQYEYEPAIRELTLAICAAQAEARVEAFSIAAAIVDVKGNEWRSAYTLLMRRAAQAEKGGE